MFFVLSASSTPFRVGVVNRVAAKVVDILVVFLLAALVLYPLGPLLGFLYSLCGDGLVNGQSLGKKLLKLQVVNRIHKRPADWKDSVLRNTPVGVATFFGIIPIWGWLILGLIGVPLMIMEVYLMVSVETGHRLGDVLGDTEVIELKR